MAQDDNTIYADGPSKIVRAWTPQGGFRFWAFAAGSVRRCQTFNSARKWLDLNDAPRRRRRAQRKARAITRRSSR